MRATAGAVVLLAWAILFNPGSRDAPMTQWQNMGEYDAAWLCEQNLLLFLAERPWLEGAYLEGAIRCERTDRLKKETPASP